MIRVSELSDDELIDLIRTTKPGALIPYESERDRARIELAINETLRPNPHAAEMAGYG